MENLAIERAAKAGKKDDGNAEADQEEKERQEALDAAKNIGE